MIKSRVTNQIIVMQLANNTPAVITGFKKIEHCLVSLDSKTNHEEIYC